MSPFSMRNFAKSPKSLPAVYSPYWLDLGLRTWITTMYLRSSLVTMPTNEPSVQPGPLIYFPLKAICDVPVFPHNV